MRNNNGKKALIVTTISGFIPQFAMNDVRILRKEGYEVHYASNFKNPIYSFDKESFRDQGIILHQIDIHKSPTKMLKHISVVKQLINIIDTEKINLVHCHNPMGGVDGRYAAHYSKMKPVTIYTAHGFHFYKGAPAINWLLYHTMERWMAHKTDILVTINKEDYKRSKRFHLKKNGLFRQIHGVGVDMNRFKTSDDMESRNIKRESIGVPRNAFHIVTAAEINDNKNQAVVIKAIAQCEYEDIYYSICGKGPEEKTLRKLIDEVGLHDRVRFLGYRTDMEEILRTADCFAFPSIREGLGMAAIEALSSSVPLIVADNRGTREYAISEVNAYICDSSDVDEFKRAIVELHNDAEKRKLMAEKCRDSVRKFSKDNNNTLMTSIYHEAMRKVDEKCERY